MGFAGGNLYESLRKASDDKHYVIYGGTHAVDVSVYAAYISSEQFYALRKSFVTFFERSKRSSIVMASA
jgi:hypothetical protein